MLCYFLKWKCFWTSKSGWLHYTLQRYASWPVCTNSVKTQQCRFSSTSFVHLLPYTNIIMYLLTECVHAEMMIANKLSAVLTNSSFISFDFLHQWVPLAFTYINAMLQFHLIAHCWHAFWIMNALWIVSAFQTS